LLVYTYTGLMIETIKVSVRFFFRTFLFLRYYLFIYLFIMVFWHSIFFNVCRLYIYIYLSTYMYISWIFYICTYMHICIFFRFSKLNWIVCRDCGMWHSRELKKKKSTKIRNKKWKKINTDSRGMQCNSFFFIWPNSLKRYSFSGEQEEMRRDK